MSFNSMLDSLQIKENLFKDVKYFATGTLDTKVKRKMFLVRYFNIKL